MRENIERAGAEARRPEDVPNVVYKSVWARTRDKEGKGKRREKREEGSFIFPGLSFSLSPSLSPSLSLSFFHSLSVSSSRFASFLQSFFSLTAVGAKRKRLGRGSIDLENQMSLSQTGHFDYLHVDWHGTTNLV